MAVTIDECGNVVDPKPISGPDELIAAAITAVKQWKFRPFMPLASPQQLMLSCMSGLRSHTDVHPFDKSPLHSKSRFATQSVLTPVGVEKVTSISGMRFSRSMLEGSIRPCSV